MSPYKFHVSSYYKYSLVIITQNYFML